uniref:Uncharacterized protein n=1 Tax=Oryza brachyantha TaxID=4533 RepID=J3LVZ1_ORYBR
MTLASNLYFFLHEGCSYGSELIYDEGSGGVGIWTAPSSICVTLSMVGRIVGSSWRHQSATATKRSTFFMLKMASSSPSTTHDLKKDHPKAININLGSDPYVLEPFRGNISSSTPNAGVCLCLIQLKKLC